MPVPDTTEDAPHQVAPHDVPHGAGGPLNNSARHPTPRPRVTPRREAPQAWGYPTEGAPQARESLHGRSTAARSPPTVGSTAGPESPHGGEHTGLGSPHGRGSTVGPVTPTEGEHHRPRVIPRRGGPGTLCWVMVETLGTACQSLLLPSSYRLTGGLEFRLPALAPTAPRNQGDTPEFHSPSGLGVRVRTCLKL